MSRLFSISVDKVFVVLVVNVCFVYVSLNSEFNIAMFNVDLFFTCFKNVLFVCHCRHTYMGSVILEWATEFTFDVFFNSTIASSREHRPMIDRFTCVDYRALPFAPCPPQQNGWRCSHALRIPRM